MKLKELQCDKGFFFWAIGQVQILFVELGLFQVQNNYGRSWV